MRQQREKEFMVVVAMVDDICAAEPGSRKQGVRGGGGERSDGGFVTIEIALRNGSGRLSHARRRSRERDLICRASGSRIRRGPWEE
eukprot:297756-Hanusia_phi.AAC.1